MAKRRSVILQKREERRKNNVKRAERTALFLTTKTGIVEIVNKFLQVHPAAIYLSLIHI